MALTPKQIREAMGEAGSTMYDNLDQNVKIVTWVLVAIVASLLFALGAITNDFLAMKQASYQNLQDEVQAQNAKIDTLNRELGLQRIRSEMASSTVSNKY